MTERDTMTGRPSDERSADAYIDAVNAVMDIAKMAVPRLKSRGGKAAAVAGAVESAAPYVRAAAEQLPKVAPVAKKAANAVADKVHS